MSRFKKPLLFILGFEAVLLICFFIYSYFFLFFAPIAKVEYDSEKVSKILSSPHAFVFSRMGALYLHDFSDEMVLIPSLTPITKKPASFKISESKKYITWDSQKGIVALNITDKTVYQVYNAGYRESYDLSPVEDIVAFVRNNELTVVDLDNGYIKKRVKLPILKNPHGRFNHIKYSPDGKKLYIRSIHEFEQEWKHEKEDFVFDFSSNSLRLLAISANPVNLAPLWANDSSSLYFYENTLKQYTLTNDLLRAVISGKDFNSLKPYAVSPSGKFIIFLSKTQPIPPTAEYSPSFYVLDASDKVTQKLFELDEVTKAILIDIGWFDDKTIWVTYTEQSPFNKNLSLLTFPDGIVKTTVNGIDLHSLHSVYSPIVEAYTLFER